MVSEVVENVIVSPPPEEDVVAGVEGGNISKLSSLPPPSSGLPNASSPVSLVSVQTSGASIVSKHNAAPCSTDPH
jgi:hypothetical protein